MIELKNIGLSIGTKVLLSGISGFFEEGRISLVIGPNGAGKSTLIKVVAGQKRPGLGEVLYDGKLIENHTGLELAKTRAVLSQNVDIAFPMEVSEVVMMGRYPHFSTRPTGEDQRICKQAMDLFDLREMRNRNYMTLSGGEKQRVHFARVLAQIWNDERSESRCLLLDEPLNSLDVYYQHHFMEIIKKLVQEQNLVVLGVVHDLNLAAKYADYLMLLNYGEVMSVGKPEEVLSVENIKLAYKIEPKTLIVDNSVQLFF